HKPRIALPILGAFWAAGGVFIWWLVPPSPRDWQPPQDESYICGFLGSGRTLITAGFPAPDDVNGMGLRLKGPIRLWDIETGNLLASYFTSADPLAWVRGTEAQDLILVMQRDGRPEQYNFRRTLLDAWTGKEVASFTCHIPRAFALAEPPWWWVTSNDARTTAFITYDKDEPCVELFDVASGRRLHRFHSHGGPICFSSDGRRFAARSTFDRGAGVGPRSSVWDVPTGESRGTFYGIAKGFSPDGELLLGSDGDVWEIASGSSRFKVPNADFSSDTCVFASD